MADFPTALPNFGPDEQDGEDYNLAAHINKLRLELRAVAAEVGTRSGTDPSMGTNVSSLLEEMATVLGYFDGDGKLPHSGNASYQDPQDFTSITNMTWLGDPYARPKWYVDGGGICHWQGVLQTSWPAHTPSQIALTGAPAPYDAAIHTYGVRFGKANGAGVGVASNAQLMPISAWGNVFANYPLAQYSIEPSGWVHLRGIITPQSVYGVTAGVCAADGLPRPGDGYSQIIPVQDMGSPTAGNSAIGLNTWSTGGNGPLGQMRTMAVLPDGSLITGPLGSNADAQSYWYPGHFYNIQGGYQGPIPCSIDVLPDGRGQVSMTAYGAGFIDLDGVSYRVA
jgi:hypothetical protein